MCTAYIVQIQLKYRYNSSISIQKLFYLTYLIRTIRNQQNKCDSISIFNKPAITDK